MSRFFVGQRVKKVAGIDIGNTGVGHSFERNDFWSMDVRVRWDNSGPCLNGRASKAGDVTFAKQAHLEPILPSGHQPSEYTFQGLMNDLRSGVAA